MKYSHTQVGYTICGALAVAAIAVSVGLFFLGQGPVLGGVLMLLLLAAVLFGTLTIEIERGVLTWSFGPGLIRRSVRLSDIRRAEVVRNPWYYGWGIHLTPHGWLYNVSGFDAVQVELEDGKKFRLGTDEPERLLAAILRERPREE